MKRKYTSVSSECCPPVERGVSNCGRTKTDQPSGSFDAPKRPSFLLISLLFLIINASWAVYHYQFESLPVPLSASQSGRMGFSEEVAMKHVKALTDFGPHPVGSDSLNMAVQYVLEESKKIKKSAHWEVDVELDNFYVEAGASTLQNGMFAGKTLVYSDLNHIVLRILPKYSPRAEENSILVSSHIDTVFSTGGAGDCSSCVATMLELARALSHWAHGFNNGIIFLFNVGEEDGLNGAHSFITQHSWSSTVRLAIDLEAMGIGGKSSIFQGGPHPWPIEIFANVAKYPSGQIISQDIFSSGIIKSATDFQVYREVADLSGLDFAYLDKSAVYHTKNDKLDLLKSGSIQHLGENMLAFLLHVGLSSHVSSNLSSDGREKEDSVIYFDILGFYMVVYRKKIASMLHYSVIFQSLSIWIVSLYVGGFSAVISLILSCLSIVLMFVFAIGLSVLVAFLLPLLSSSPVPYIATPWLVVGIFAAPALVGAVLGQHLGHLILMKYLSKAHSRREKLQSINARYVFVKLEAERWLFKSASVQWFVLLALGCFYEIGSSYLPLIWLTSPSFFYGMFDATLTPARSPKPLKTVTLVFGLAFPVLVSAGIIIRFVDIMIGGLVRFDRNPGSLPDWLGSVVISILIAVSVCLVIGYFLSYIHLSDAKQPIIVMACICFILSIIAVLSGTFPPFTEDTSRAINVVHVIDSGADHHNDRNIISYVSLFSTTPGQLLKEAEYIDEGFVCGRSKVVDFVSFSVEYGCWTKDNSMTGWNKSEIPSLLIERDVNMDSRLSEVSIDTKLSTRWSLAINTDVVKSFILEGGKLEVKRSKITGSDEGWHVIRFSGGGRSPRHFNLTLLWWKDYEKRRGDSDRPLLKLRTDVNRLTPKSSSVMGKLPPWCSIFGKSSSPLTLAFLSTLSV